MSIRAKRQLVVTHTPRSGSTRHLHIQTPQDASLDSSSYSLFKDRPFERKSRMIHFVPLCQPSFWKLSAPRRGSLSFPRGGESYSPSNRCQPFFREFLSAPRCGSLSLSRGDGLYPSSIQRQGVFQAFPCCPCGLRRTGWQPYSLSFMRQAES